MITETHEWYKCEYCGKVSESYDTIKKCEEQDELIKEELEKLIDCCHKLNDLGCTIRLSDPIFFSDNELDLKVLTRLTKDYKIYFKAEEDAKRNIVIGSNDTARFALCDHDITIRRDNFE